MDSNPATSEESQDSPVQSFSPTILNNVDESDLDEETLTKLRGDSIGDTVYSKRFVLKTLLQYSDLNWDDDYEKDLCVLWDMTVDLDVCKYLFEVSYPSLACSALENYTDNVRFVEIVIGMFANILTLCTDEKLEKEEIYACLSYIDSDDPLVLVQVIRFLIAVVRNNKELYFINDNVVTKLSFILANSLNSDLVLKTLDLVTRLTTEFKLDKKLLNIDLTNACFTAYLMLMNLQDDKNKEREFDTTESQEILHYFVNSIDNICCYADMYEELNLLVSLKQFANNLLFNELKLILKFFTEEDNLFPVTQESEITLSCSAHIILTLETKFNEKLFLSLFKILYLLSVNEVEEYDFSNLLECICYFIFIGNEIVNKCLFENFSTTITKTVVRFIRKKDVNYSFNYRKNLANIIKHFK